MSDESSEIAVPMANTVTAAATRGTRRIAMRVSNQRRRCCVMGQVIAQPARAAACSEFVLALSRPRAVVTRCGDATDFRTNGER
jgi:hypothetical protein